MILTTVPEFCVHGISQKLITTEITKQIRWRMNPPPPSPPVAEPRLPLGVPKD
jgi:hypothetical protein